MGWSGETSGVCAKPSGPHGCAISVDFVEIELSRALDTFEAVTGLEFVIPPRLDTSLPVTLVHEDTTWNEALSMLLTQHRLDWCLRERQLVIHKTGLVPQGTDP